MDYGKRTPVDFTSVNQRPIRYATGAINVAALLAAILFVAWVLGKMIAALHALIFALALEGTPSLVSSTSPLPKVEAFKAIEAPADRPAEKQTTGPDFVYTVQRDNGRR